MLNPSSPWEGYVFSSTVSIFTKYRNLDGAFSDVGELLLWGLTIPGNDDRICNEYGNCTIPIYEYLFFRFWGSVFPLLLSKWVLSTIIWWIHLNFIPPVGHMLSLISIGVSMWRENHLPSYSFISFATTKATRSGSFCADNTYFRHFSRTTFLHIEILFGHPFHPDAHITICAVESEVERKCKPLFPYCWSTHHFLLGNGSYLYKESDFTGEDSFHKKFF